MEYFGTCHFLGDNIDTDLLLPGKYLSLTKAEDLALHCLEGIEENWGKKVQVGDILIAGKNFGCGSSREHAATALYATGIRAILAPSFGNIFYRNGINVGILALTVSHNFLLSFKEGDKAAILLDDNACKVEKNGESILCPPLDPMVRNILSAGGLMAYLAKSYSP